MFDDCPRLQPGGEIKLTPPLPSDIVIRPLWTASDCGFWDSTVVYCCNLAGSTILTQSFFYVNPVYRFSIGASVWIVKKNACLLTAKCQRAGCSPAKEEILTPTTKPPGEYLRSRSGSLMLSWSGLRRSEAIYCGFIKHVICFIHKVRAAFSPRGLQLTSTKESRKLSCNRGE